MKEELTVESKKEILNNNTDIVYKFCHKNKSKYIDEYENFESFISECLVIAYEMVKYWEPEKGALSTFLFNTLKWTLLNKKNRDKSVNHISLEELCENPQELDLVSESSGLYDSNLMDSKLLQFIEPLLNKENRMYYLEGKTFQEIADIQKIAPSTAKVRSYKNIKEIRKIIEEEYEY